MSETVLSVLHMSVLLFLPLEETEWLTCCLKE